MQEREHATWGRTTTGGGRKAGANARSLHRLSQLQLRERLACAGTVHPPQLATRTTQFLSGMARTETASPQGGERNHPLHAHAVQENRRDRWCPGGNSRTANLLRLPVSGVLVVLAQTEGDDTPVPPIPGFDIDTALCALNITRTPFDELNGNIQGFAHGREIAVNPVAALPHKTPFHEIAHIVLGHTASEKLVDSEQTARHIREVEAESVALICCETLGLEGADFCRGYIQHWLKTEKEIPNQSAARIFAATTSILKAGTPAAGSH